MKQTIDNLLYRVEGITPEGEFISGKYAAQTFNRAQELALQGGRYKEVTFTTCLNKTDHPEGRIE